MVHPDLKCYCCTLSHSQKFYNAGYIILLAFYRSRWRQSTAGLPKAAVSLSYTAVYLPYSAANPTIWRIPSPTAGSTIPRSVWCNNCISIINTQDDWLNIYVCVNQYTIYVCAVLNIFSNHLVKKKR